MARAKPSRVVKVKPKAVIKRKLFTYDSLFTSDKRSRFRIVIDKKVFDQGTIIDFYEPGVSIEGVWDGENKTVKLQPPSLGTGRPTVMTAEIIAKLSAAYSWGASDKEACGFAEISPSSLYYYQRLHPEFSERKTHMREQMILRARKGVVESFDRNAEMAWRYLTSKRPEEFNKDVQGMPTVAIQVNIVDHTKVVEVKQIPQVNIIKDGNDTSKKTG